MLLWTVATLILGQFVTAELNCTSVALFAEEPISAVTLKLNSGKKVVFDRLKSDTVLMNAGAPIKSLVVTVGTNTENLVVPQIVCPDAK